MIEKTTKIFKSDIYSKPPKKIFSTNKTDAYHIDDLWSLDKSDLKDYGPANNRGYRFVLVIIDTFSNYDWTVHLQK